MAISKTQICNLSLSLVHARQTIEDVDTEKTTEALTAKLWYDHARQEVLEDFDWGVARRRDNLAVHGEDPDDVEWTYRYQWPADCIAPRYIVNPVGLAADAVPFDVEFAEDGTRSIVTNLETAVLVYTKDLTTTSLFSPGLITCVSFRLAYYLAGVLTQKKSLQDELLKGYYVELTRAAAKDASYAIPKPPREASWIEGR